VPASKSLLHSNFAPIINEHVDNAAAAAAIFLLLPLLLLQSFYCCCNGS
jgi:hypothetical protein